MGLISGLENVVAAETRIGHVDGTNGHLIYRGHWAKELAVNHSFEEAAFLLWHDRLPSVEELRRLREELTKESELPESMGRLLDAMPERMPMMSVVLAAAAALTEGAEDGQMPTLNQAVRITALLPSIIAYRYRKLTGRNPVTPEVMDGSSEEGVVARYLRQLFDVRPTTSQVRALSAYLVLAMEHGLNASTFTARVVASTGSDLYSSVAGAVGAMKGPLHGGAPSEVLRMLDEIGEKEQAEPYLRGKLERGERLMGFGHRIYKTRDPRAEALREVAAQAGHQDRWLELACHVEETAVRLLETYKPGRSLYANVEFYAAAVMRAVGMPPELFTPTFTVARVVGWTAHILEQSANNRIYRPQSHYVGAWPPELRDHGDQWRVVGD